MSDGPRMELVREPAPAGNFGERLAAAEARIEELAEELDALLRADAALRALLDGPPHIMSPPQSPKERDESP